MSALDLQKLIRGAPAKHAAEQAERARLMDEGLLVEVVERVRADERAYDEAMREVEE